MMSACAAAARGHAPRSAPANAHASTSAPKPRTTLRVRAAACAMTTPRGPNPNPSSRIGPTKPPPVPMPRSVDLTAPGSFDSETSTVTGNATVQHLSKPGREFRRTSTSRRSVSGSRSLRPAVAGADFSEPPHRTRPEAAAPSRPPVARTADGCRPRPAAPGPRAGRRTSALVIGERVGEEKWSESPWIPAFAGMTATGRWRLTCPALQTCVIGESRWIPRLRGNDINCVCPVIPAKAGMMRSTRSWSRQHRHSRDGVPRPGHLPPLSGRERWGVFAHAGRPLPSFPRRRESIRP